MTKEEAILKEAMMRFDEQEKNRWTGNQSLTQNNSSQQSSQQQRSALTGSLASLVQQAQAKLQSLKRHVVCLEKEAETLCSQLQPDGQLDGYQKQQVIEHSRYISSLSMVVQSLIAILVNQSSTPDQHGGEDETHTGTP